MINIYGWKAYVLPQEGRTARVSNRSQQVLVECNKRQGITYTQVKREVYITQNLVEANEAGNQSQLLWTEEGKEDEYWSTYQHLIPAQNKDGFFLEFLWRAPAMIYMFNPETAATCMTNVWLREMLGTADPEKIGAFGEKYFNFVRGFQGRCFPYLMLSHISSGSHPMLPMEIRVGVYLSLIASYLQTGIILGTEEIPTFPMITAEMMASLGSPLTSTGSAYQGPSPKTDKLMAKQEKRSNMPGFWTDLLCHYRCIMCGMIMSENEDGSKICAGRCQNKEVPVKCSLCDTILIGQKQMILHFSTLCRRTVGDACPVCAGQPLSGTCVCHATSQTVHRALRNLINTNENTLFRVDNMEILSAILFQHYAGNLTYSTLEAKDTDYAWWQVDKVTKPDYGYKVSIEDIGNIIRHLPTLSKDRRIVTFPGTEKAVAVEALMPPQTTKSTSSEKEESMGTPNETGIPSWMGADTSSEASTPSLESTNSLAWDHEDEDWDEEAKRKKKEDREKKEKEDREKNKEDKTRKKKEDKEKKEMEDKMRKEKKEREDKSKKEREEKNKKEKEDKDKKEREGEERKEKKEESSGDESSSEDTDSGEDEKEEDKSDDEDSDDKRSRSRSRRERNRHKCRNETHRRPKLFGSSMEKLRHVIAKHKCPFSAQGCKYYNEFEKKTRAHVAQMHDDTDWQECDIEKCTQKFATKLLLAHHKDIHPKCVSCQKHFFGAEELKEHHPCFNLRAERFPERREKGGAYLSSLPTNEVDIFRRGNQDPNVQLADSMAQLCHLIPMDQRTKDTLVENFKKCAAMQMAAQNLEKYPASSRKMTRLLIEPPCFEHSAGQKENLGKVSDFLGKDVEVWSPSNSPRSQFRNFLTLSELNQKMIAATAACKLLESSACCLLLQRFSVTAKNAIESRSFSPPSTWSYITILQMSQNLYYCLNLEEVAIEAEESRKKEGEHLCEYASRAYKLLSTAALGREVEEKERYIKSNLRRLVFRALPPKLRTKVDNLELRFGISYDSKDLLDFFKTEQLEQSHLRGDSMADTSLMEPQKIQVVKKEKYKNKEEQKEPKGEPSKRQKDQRPKGGNHKIGNLIQESKLGAVGQLLPPKPIVTPKPPFAAQGMAQGPKDLFNQAAKASSKMEYIRKKKAQLGLSEDDTRRFCFKCGSDGENYHVASRCKLPHTEEIHQCGDGLRLFHRPSDCPRKKSLRSIRIVKE